MLTEKERELAEKMNGNTAASKPELKRPNPPAQPPAESNERDAQLALQEAIGDEAALTQDVINAHLQRGENLAVRAKVAQFTRFAETNADLTRQMGKAFRQLNQATDSATDAIEVETVEGSGFFSSVCDSLGSASFSLSGRSPLQLGGSANGNGNGKSTPS